MDLSTERILMHPLRVSSSQIVLGAYTRGSMELTAEALDRETGATMLKLQAYVLSQQVLQDKVTEQVKYPATWWQHLKLSLPAWVRRRCPVRYSSARLEADITRYDTYPRADVPYQEASLGTPVIWDQLKIVFDAEPPGIREPVYAQGFISRERVFVTEREIALLAVRRVEEEHLADWISGGTGVTGTAAEGVHSVLRILRDCHVNTDALVRHGAFSAVERRR